MVKIYRKKSQNNSPLHLPFTLHLKSPTLKSLAVYLTNIKMTVTIVAKKEKKSNLRCRGTLKKNAFVADQKRQLASL